MMRLVLILAMLFTLSFAAMAQETAPAAAPEKAVEVKVTPTITVPAVVTPVPVSETGSITAPTTDELKALMGNIMNVKGAGTVALVITIVQALLMAMRSFLGGYAGLYRMLIISALTWILGVLSFIYVNNCGVVEAMLYAANLVLAQGFINQLWKQFGKVKKDETEIAKKV